MKYEIKGGELPVVVCFMDAGEAMITEKGSMSWMSPNMKMETTSNGRGRKSARKNVRRRGDFPEPLYSGRRSGDDRVCIQFSGTDQTLGDRSGKRDSCAKSRFSGGAGKR